MYPDLAGGDTGELTGASVLGGVPHPPGYPLYAMLGRGFVGVSPFGGNPARKLNLLSCFYGAGASALLHWSVLRRTQMNAEISLPAAWAGMSYVICPICLCSSAVDFNPVDNDCAPSSRFTV